MAKRPSFSELSAVGIRHFDEMIHEQDKDWLIKHFRSPRENPYGRKAPYPVNVSKLMRNIIWQLRERIVAKEREPLRELLRTFWYMYVKPTLGRCGALSNKTDQYAQLIDNLVFLVVKKQLMSYSDIGFRDDNRANRKVGINANVILFSEKLGHQDFLGEIASLYNVSILALGGQPSALNVEYFVDELKKSGVDLRRSFYLFSIVDYDTSGWIIRDAFINDLKAYGIKHISCVDLINPDMLTPDEIAVSKYPLPDSSSMRAKNSKWLKQIKGMHYDNQQYLEPEVVKNKKILFGLEAESVSGKRLTDKLEEVMVPLLGKSERLLRIFQLERINESLKELIFIKVT